MENKFQKIIYNIGNLYSRGEILYKSLVDNKANGMEILVCPAHVGDTVWIMMYSEAYKKYSGADKLLVVVSESQEKMISLFEMVDDVFSISNEEMNALMFYMGFNKLWYANGIRYAHFKFEILVDCNEISIIERSMFVEQQEYMIKTRKDFLGLPDDAVQNDAILPSETKGLTEKYSNAVMLLPAAQTQPGTVPISFWVKLAAMLKEKGYAVYCNYNNLNYEVMIEGTEPLSSSLVEIYNLSKCFKRFIGFRSGILDLLMLGQAAITVIHPQYDNIQSMEIEKNAPIIDNMYQFESHVYLKSYQYRKEWEDELLRIILEKL